jgi:5-methylcytosine-specific restriction endonuclease McrA
MSEHRYPGYGQDWERVQKVREAHQRRQSRLERARAQEDHSDREWFALCLAFPNCVRCGDPALKIGKDHIIPLCHDGSNGIDNLQPLCLPCNKAKGAQWADYRPDDWRRRMEAILKFAELL